LFVYLDQNKWIELAKIYHGKTDSLGASSFLQEMEASIECGYKYPLSAIHYMEFSRISNLGRRRRLGEVMWKYSQGQTFVSTREIVLCEIEQSLMQFYSNITTRSLNLVGNGICHAFGSDMSKNYPQWVNEFVDEALLKGSEILSIDPISYYSQIHRESFREHLEKLNETKHELDKTKWDDWLYAIALTDILEPLKEVMDSNGLGAEEFASFTKEKLTRLVDSMPSRNLDVHLHRQVLKNSNYLPKISDLEDWAGLGIAACYCDIVVCEKHFAAMLRRDGFKPKARIVTNLYEIFSDVINLS
jgi:hypothetical protein